MNLTFIERDLAEIRKRYSGVISTTYYVTGNDSVGWPSYTGAMFNGVNYYAQYRSIIDRRQYSFLFHNNDAFQVYCKFKDDAIIARATLTILALFY